MTSKEQIRLLVAALTRIANRSHAGSDLDAANIARKALNELKACKQTKN